MKWKFLLIILIGLFLLSGNAFAKSYTEEELTFLTNELCKEIVEDLDNFAKTVNTERSKKYQQIYQQKDFQECIIKPLIKKTILSIPRNEMINGGKFSSLSIKKIRKTGEELRNCILLQLNR